MDKQLIFDVCQILKMAGYQPEVIGRKNWKVVLVKDPILGTLGEVRVSRRVWSVEKARKIVEENV